MYKLVHKWKETLHTKINTTDIEEFCIDNTFPHGTRGSFLKHLMPYTLISTACTNKKVLELGIGEGFGCYYLSKTAAMVTGLDFNYNCKEYLNKFMVKYYPENINFINADALAIPFKDETFDIIISCQVIEHIPEDRLFCFLEEINRVLKTDGIALISTLNIEHNMKNPHTYEKFYQHHKEFNRDALEVTLQTVFTAVDVLGLNFNWRHRFFNRLKKWGIAQWYSKTRNPVARFFNSTLPRDYTITHRVSKRSMDLIALCRKV